MRVFGRRFRSARSSDELTPEMYAKRFPIRRPPRGLVHGKSAPQRGQARLPFIGDALDHARRVTIKIRYHGRAKANYGARLKAHVDYLQRDGAGEDGRKAPFFDASQNGLDGEAFAERIRYDDRHYRLIVAPNDGEKIADMTAYVRELMARAESDLGSRLEWIAVVHEKGDKAHAENRHAHVLLRGVDDRRQELRLASEFVKEGLRFRAQELATEILGPMSERELAAYRDRGRTGERQR